jgi:hypothetical protein
VAASSTKDLGMARAKNLNNTILERYEYDAYGNPNLFTGRRVDIMDSGSLKIQYNSTGSPNAFSRLGVQTAATTTTPVDG